MRQVRKGRKSEKEAVSRVEKKHYKTVCESCQSFKYHRSYRVLKTSILYAAGNNSKLTPLCLWILNLADRDRDHLLLFIC